MDKKYVAYILLTHSGSLLSKCIKQYTQEPYSHVSLALDIVLEDLYSFGRLNPNNPFIGGFIREDIINGTYARFPNTNCALYALEINWVQYEALKKEIERFNTEKEYYGYNLVGLLGIVFNIPIEREYNYFCSQFVATLLYNSDIHIFNKPAALVSPRDFRKCKELHLLYEGKLSNYANDVLLYNQIS